VLSSKPIRKGDQVDLSDESVVLGGATSVDPWGKSQTHDLQLKATTQIANFKSKHQRLILCTPSNLNAKPLFSYIGPSRFPGADVESESTLLQRTTNGNVARSLPNST